MKQPQTTQSIHASIHEIIIQDKKNKLRQDQVSHLFTSPELIQIDTTDFNRHPYMFKNQLFTFFVHQLEKWNKKITNKQITPFYRAELNKYHFIQSSLKIIALKKSEEINQYLEELSMWYSKNSYNIPQPSVLMKKYDTSEEWQVRKTFKSNTPSEQIFPQFRINNYRRRFFYSTDNKNAPMKNFEITKKKENNFRKDSTNSKLKSTMSNTLNEDFNDDKFVNTQSHFGLFRQINHNNEKNLLKNQNKEVRNMREEIEIKDAEDEWRTTHSRFGERSCQNFYNGNFHTNKYFAQSTSRVPPRNVFTASYNKRNTQEVELINNIKKRRLRTSLGLRNNFTKQQQDNSKIQEKKQTQKKIEKKPIKQKPKQKGKQKPKQIPKQTLTFANWIDNFLIDEEKLTISNTFDSKGNAMNLISNPFETAKKSKIKRKKK